MSAGRRIAVLSPPYSVIRYLFSTLIGTKNGRFVILISLKRKRLLVCIGYKEAEHVGL